MSHSTCMYDGINRAQAMLAGLVIAGLALAGIAPALAEEEKQGDVESRGLGQMERPMMPPGRPAQPGAPGQSNMQLPTFPQNFDVQGPEIRSFGFAVTQPGPITIDVQAQGTPLFVTLQSPGGQPITQQATGNLRMNYTVTPQDVQRSLFWLVQLRAWCEEACLKAGTRQRSVGSIVVQHPPVNDAQVQAALAAHQQGAQQQTTQKHAQAQQARAQLAAQMEQAFQERKTQFDRQQLDQRAARHAQIQPQLDQLRSRMGGQIRPRGLEESAGTSGEPGAPPEGEIGTRALLPGRTLLTPMMVNPNIQSLSVSQGGPGEPVLFNGSGFGNGGGEVHFIMNPGKDVVAQVGYWDDSQLFVTFPTDVSGIEFAGQAYVVRNQDKMKSNLMAFRFMPILELREIRATLDKQLTYPVYSFSPENAVFHGNSNIWSGYQNNDVLFGNTRLKNGWHTAEAFVNCWAPSLCDGGAVVWDTKMGTDWPYLNVRWWVNSAPFMWSAEVDYSFAVRIKGPQGLPDGVVVP